jgi:hypothetical protein
LSYQRLRKRLHNCYTFLYLPKIVTFSVTNGVIPFAPSYNTFSILMSQILRMEALTWFILLRLVNTIKTYVFITCWKFLECRNNYLLRNVLRTSRFDRTRSASGDMHKLTNYKFVKLKIWIKFWIKLHLDCVYSCIVKWLGTIDGVWICNWIY